MDANAEFTDNVLALIRSTTAAVMKHATHVSIDEAAIAKEIEANTALYGTAAAPADWAGSIHYHGDSDLTAQYVLVLDALNFCFWPLPGYEYDDLARALKAVLEKDKTAFDAQKLAKVTPQVLQSWLQRTAGEQIPLLEERARLVREVGIALDRHYHGKASELIKAAEHSAARLVSLVSAMLPGFRDHAIYRGQQVFLYKRAQIFVADIWGAFAGKGLGHFTDMDMVTCFADYRVPQILWSLGIIKLSESFAQRVTSLCDLVPGSTEEVEIRAATIQAVEMMVREVRRRGQHSMSCVLMDWVLWNRAEARKDSLPPHHRVLTVYY